MAADWTLTGSLGVTQRRLTEYAATGGKLLTETGPMAEARLEGTRTLEDGSAWGLRASVLRGDLDYNGQTQAGAPLATTTRQWETEAVVMWRPWAPAAWGEAWLLGGVLVNFRGILSTPLAGGLDETSTAALAGVRWRSPALAAGSWSWNVEADARTSVVHRLHVDYHGLLDDSHFRGARKNLLALRVVGTPADSPWSFSLEWSGLRQPASRSVPVTLNGVLVPGTTVRQPELTIRDLALRVSRRF